MVSGFDRYFQITKCFRDEDLRADRQPEFTQVDIETSFLGENEIMDIVEEMIRQMLKKVQNVDLPAKFPRMSFQEAMSKYGSDKPDMRVTLEITELSDVMKDVDFKVFAGAANMEGGRVAALRVPNGAAISRSEIDAYTEFVKIYGAKGLAYIKINDISKLNEEGLQSPIVKNIHVKALQAIVERTGAQNGDIVFFGADKTKVVNEALGALRVKIGHEKIIWMAVPGHRCGWWISRCLNMTKKINAGPLCIIRSPRPKMVTKIYSLVIPVLHYPKPTIWC